MADSVIGKLIYKITGDTSQLDKSVKKTNKEVKTFGKSLGNLGKLIRGAAVTGAIIFAAKKVFEFGRAFIGAASDAEETANKFNVVFESVADEARATADRIQDEFKLSDETVQNFLSGVGDITSGLGATSEEALLAADQITTLGLDINSFANLSGGAEQAVKALTSLFTGEREAAKALGIVINDTNLKAYAEDQGKIFKQLTPLEKGFLSLELATTQSQLAIGDFARSADSYANTAKASTEATKDLKAALGESLLPAATESLRIFTELTTQLTEFTREMNTIRDENDALSDSYKGLNVDFEAAIGAQKRVIEEQKASLQVLINSGQIEEDIAQGLIDLSRQKLDLLERQFTSQQKALIGQENNLAASSARKNAR